MSPEPRPPPARVLLGCSFPWAYTPSPGFSPLFFLELWVFLGKCFSPPAFIIFIFSVPIRPSNVNRGADLPYPIVMQTLWVKNLGLYAYLKTTGRIRPGQAKKTDRPIRHLFSETQDCARSSPPLLISSSCGYPLLRFETDAWQVIFPSVRHTCSVLWTFRAEADCSFFFAIPKAGPIFFPPWLLFYAPLPSESPCPFFFTMTEESAAWGGSNPLDDPPIRGFDNQHLRASFFLLDLCHKDVSTPDSRAGLLFPDAFPCLPAILFLHTRRMVPLRRRGTNDLTLYYSRQRVSPAITVPPLVQNDHP